MLGCQTVTVTVVITFSYVAYPVVSGKDGEDHAAAAELLDDEVVRDGLADQ